MLKMFASHLNKIWFEQYSNYKYCVISLGKCLFLNLDTVFGQLWNGLFLQVDFEKNCAVVDDLSMAYPFGINPKIDTPKFLLIAAPYEIAVPTTT